jgi:hypothetical protein
MFWRNIRIIGHYNIITKYAKCKRSGIPINSKQVDRGNKCIEKRKFRIKKWNKGN